MTGLNEIISGGEGRFLNDTDVNGILISREAKETLQVDLNDIVTFCDRNFTVVGVFDSQKLGKIVDLNGEPILPQKIRVLQTQGGNVYLPEYVSPENVVIIIGETSLHLPLNMVTSRVNIKILGEGGAIEAFLEAREQGLIKYIGFSAHSEEAALALIDRFDFDSILFPINWVCWFQGNFGPKVVEKAKEKNVAILALKTLAKRRLKEGEERKWPKCWYAPVESFDEAFMAVRFTLSMPVTAAVTPGHVELFRWMCDAAEKFKPLSEEEMKIIEKKSEGLEPIFPQKREG